MDWIWTTLPNMLLIRLENGILDCVALPSWMHTGGRTLIWNQQLQCGVHVGVGITSSVRHCEVRYTRDVLQVANHFHQPIWRAQHATLHQLIDVVCMFLDQRLSPKMLTHLLCQSLTDFPSGGEVASICETKNVSNDVSNCFRNIGIMLKLTEALFNITSMYHNVYVKIQDAKVPYLDQDCCITVTKYTS